MADVSTQNYTVTKALPTNELIDVTVCNLDPDLTIRDFIVLHNGALYTPQSNYAKVTQTSLRYLGAPLGSTTIQVRRKTPVEVIQEVKFGSKLSSDLYNDELDRTARWKAEADLNGVGAALTTQLAIPNNEAYGVTWSGDTVTPPTRQAVYNQMELRAPKASPTFTGDVFVPNLAQGNNSARAANTAYVDAGLATKANLASPVFTADPQYNVVIPIGDNDFTLANTRFVKDVLASSPALGVAPTAPTATPGTNTTQIATTQFVQQLTRPAVIANRSYNDGSAVTTRDIQFDTEDLDTNSAFGGGSTTTSSVFTVPTGLGGVYLVYLSVLFDLTNAFAANITLQLFRNGTLYSDVARVSYAVQLSPGITGATILPLNAGDTLTFRLLMVTGAPPNNNSFTIVAGTRGTRVHIARIGG